MIFFSIGAFIPKCVRTSQSQIPLVKKLLSGGGGEVKGEEVEASYHSPKEINSGFQIKGS